MPFVSGRQERFMWAQHPDIARRWTSEFGSFKSTRQAFKASPESESGESWRPGVKKGPRLPGAKRDFAKLTPSASARHKPASSRTPNEQEAMAEQPTVFQHGSRHSELGKPEALGGLRRRDVLNATRQLPHVKNP